MGVKGFFLGTIIVFVGIFLAYYGFFDKVSVEVENIGKEVVIFREVENNYQEANSQSERVYYDLKTEYGINTMRRYIKLEGDPSQSKDLIISSEVGVILERADLDKLKNIDKKFKFKEIGGKNFMVTEFPFRTNLSMLFGPRKVYPALNEFCKEKGYDKSSSVIEIKNAEESKTVYLKEIKK